MKRPKHKTVISLFPVFLYFTFYKLVQKPTRVVKPAADLHRSQLTVKPHCPWRVGGNLAGILLSTLTATIYKENTKVSTSEQRESEVQQQL